MCLILSLLISIGQAKIRISEFCTADLGPLYAFIPGRKDCLFLCIASLNRDFALIRLMAWIALRNLRCRDSWCRGVVFSGYCCSCASVLSLWVRCQGVLARRLIFLVLWFTLRVGIPGRLHSVAHCCVFRAFELPVSRRFGACLAFWGSASRPAGWGACFDSSVVQPT